MSRLLQLKQTSLLGFFACASLAYGQAPVQAKEEPRKAEQAYLDGARLVDHQQLAQAQEQFAKAVTLAPSHPEYAMALMLTKQHRVSELIQQAAKERLTGHAAKADAIFDEARKIDPENELVLEHTAEASLQTAELLQPTSLQSPSRRMPEPLYLPPIHIDPTPNAVDLHLRGDTRQVVTQAAIAYGIKTVFDTSVGTQNLRFDLDQTTYAEAMPILLKMAHLFSVAIDPKTLLVCKDTEENHQKFERQVEETIYIPGSTKEQLTELTNIVKNVFDVKQVVVSDTSGTLIVRAPEETVKAMNYVLADLVDGGSEVVMELKLVSLDRSNTRNTGATTPTSVGIFSVTAEAQQIVSANQSAVNLLISGGGYVPTGNTAQDLIAEALYLVLSGAATDAKVSNLIAVVGKGLTLTGVYLGGGGTFNFGLNTSEAHALDDLTLRMQDRQTATLRVGEKYPITTATYGSGLSSAAASALAGKTINGVSAASLAAQYLGSSTATVPQVQFEDLGLTLKATPTVMKSGMISLAIDLKIEALTGASANNIPVLTSRNFTSNISLKDGSTAIMLSDISSTEAASINGIPGLADLPGFQGTASDKLKETDSSELVMLITPHLVRKRSNEMASRRIHFSTSVPVEN